MATVPETSCRLPLNEGDVKHAMTASQKRLIEAFRSPMVGQGTATTTHRRTGRPWKWREYVELPVGCCSFLPYPHELSPKERRDFHQSMRSRIASAAKRLGAEIRSHQGEIGIEFWRVA